MLPRNVGAAVNAIYAAGYDRTLWEDSLAQLCAAIGAKNAITVPRDTAQDTIYLPFSNDLHEFAQAFVDGGWYQRDIRAIRGWPLTDIGQEVILEQDIITREDQRREPIYQELLGHYGQWWWAGITFKTPSRQYTLSVFRPPEWAPFTEEDRKLFNLLTGHLARAVTIAERVGVDYVYNSVDTLSALGEAAIFLDGAGQVLDMTARAGRLMGDGISVAGRSLIAQGSRARRAVDAKIRRTLAEGVDHEGPVRIDRPGKRPLLLDTLPVARRFEHTFIYARTIVLLVDLEDRPLPRAAHLRRLFGLTATEARIALDLVSGLSLSDAAERRGMTRETARTHLKALFHKTGTNRQSELLLLLAKMTRR